MSQTPRDNLKLRRLKFPLSIALSLLLLFCVDPAIAKDGGWDLEAYQVQIRIAIDAPGGIAEELAADLPRYIERRINACLTPRWSSSVQLATGIDRANTFAAIAAADPPPPSLPAEKEKLLLVTMRWTPEAIELAAREFDGYVQRWSPMVHRQSRQQAALPEQVFTLLRETFSPLAHFERDSKDAQRVSLKPRGASLPRGAGAAPWIKTGDVFIPIRRQTTRGGQLEKKGGIQIVPWTFIEVDETKDGQVAGRIQSASRAPFPPRRQGRVEQVAIALRADSAPSTLRLRSRTSRDKPLVGYEIYLGKPGEAAPPRFGTTDAAGQIVIPVDKSRIQFVLVKHGGALFARVPIAAGAQPRVDVPLPDDDARLAAEARLSAVREDLVDIVARRNILISRVQQKIDKRDFAAAEELIRALDELPGRPQFDLSLRTAEQTLRSDDPQMQRRIKQLFEATRTLVAQFLDLKPVNQIRDDLREAQRKGDSKSSTPKNAAKS
jgi:hypothetical protein